MLPCLLCGDPGAPEVATPTPLRPKPGDIWRVGQQLRVCDCPAEAFGQTAAEVFALEVAGCDALAPEDLAVVAHHHNASSLEQTSFPRVGRAEIWSDARLNRPPGESHKSFSGDRKNSQPQGGSRAPARAQGLSSAARVRVGDRGVPSWRDGWLAYMKVHDNAT